MNYYNPYFGGMSYAPTLGAVSNASASKGLLGKLFGGGKLSAFINGTQKTLNIINQAIPIVKQVTPVMKNAKTMFKVMNEFKRVDNTVPTQNSKNNSSTDNTVNNTKVSNSEIQEPQIDINVGSNNGPTFFL